MSKTTKIIAALGVVAGLGVAALPAFTYATESATGDVEVQVEVDPAIAMTISGNNDDSTAQGHHSSGYTYTVVTPEAGDSPASLGWYERTGSAGSYTYTASEDTTVDDDKTYCTRNEAPNYAAVDSYNPYSATPGDPSIAGQTLDTHNIPAAPVLGTSSSYIHLLPNATATGNATNGFRSTITVYTNAASGYNLTLIDKDADNALNNVNGATIPAISDATSFTAGTPAWGYKVFTTHGDKTGAGAQDSGDTEWHAVPASGSTAANISSLSTKTTNGDQTIVDYGVATDDDQATGIYTDIILYTATTIN